MEENKPPIYIIAPGKVYRRDVADPSHLPQFHQVEGLVVDKGISFGDLKGTLDYFCKQMFGPDRKTRFRAHYFPFTEPSAEADVSCGRVRRLGPFAQRREVPHVQGAPDCLKFWAAAWSTRTSTALWTSILKNTRASRSAWASSASHA